MSVFYVLDGGGQWPYPSLDEARDHAEHSLEYARDHCDPEWPTGTEDICVYECEAETDDPSEDGKLVLHVEEIEIDAPEGREEECDYWCDYELRAFEAEEDA